MKIMCRFDKTKRVIAAVLAALRDKFGDIRSHLIAMLKYQTDNGLTEMSDADRDAWLAARKDDPKLSVYMIEKSVSTALSSYKYEKTNLLDYFLLNDTEFEGDGIRKLYPLAASLIDAQRAALRESTDMYLKLTIGTGATALGTAIGAAIMSRVISCWKLKIGEIGYKNVGEVSSVASASMSNTEREIARQFLDENNLNDLAIAQRENWYADIVKISKMSKSDMAEGGYSLSDKAQMKAQLEEFYNHGVKVSGNTVKAAVFQTIKWGLAIASILLAAADTSKSDLF